MIPRRSPSFAPARRRPGTLAALALAAAAWVGGAGCNPSSGGSPPGSGGAGGTGGAMATGGTAGTGTGGAGMATDAGMDQTTPSPDAGADGPSPFGIATRAAVQTCKAPMALDQPADKLSATVCVDATNPKKPAASLIPYDVNSPLWSDGADKQRFLALPDGAVIHVKDCTREPDTCKTVAQGGTTFDEGHWVLPVGTVLVKNFLFGGRFIETRLFVRFADIWYGFSYQWNSAQTDATLV
ncbi:MAG: hypothetical protein ABUS79_28725, partial [Pseudomonadota bacterium]